VLRYLLRAQCTSYCSPPSFTSHLIAADQQPERLGAIGNLHAHVGGLRPDRHAPRLRACRCSSRCPRPRRRETAWRAPQAACCTVEPGEIGPVDDELDVGVLVAAAADVRDGWTDVRRFAVRGGSTSADRFHHGELIAFSDRRARQAHVGCCRGCGSFAGLPAIFTSVYATSGTRARMALATRWCDLGRSGSCPRRPQVDFELRLVVVVRKFLSTILNSGTLDSSTSTAIRRRSRDRHAHSSIRDRRRRRPDTRESSMSGRRSPRFLNLDQRAASIGVSVKLRAATP